MLLCRHALTIEELGQGLQRLDGPTAVIRNVQRVRRQKVFIREKEDIGFVGRRAQRNRTEILGLDILAHPLAFDERESLQLRHDVVDEAHDDVVARGDYPTTRNGHRLAGHDQHLEIAAPIHEFLEIDRHERGLGISRVPDLPVGLELDEHLALHHAEEIGIGRYVDVPELAVTHVQVIERLEKAGLSVSHVVALVPVPGPVYASGHVGLLAGKDLRRLLERFAALPQTGGARIARICQAAIAEITADPHRVLIDPADPLLGFGDGKSVHDEGFCLDIEFTDDDRVRAAPRQVEETAAVIRPQALRALPDPVFVFTLGQQVDVE